MGTIGAVIAYFAFAAVASALHLLEPAPTPCPATVAPQVKIKNGTLGGIHLPAFNEDVFLGVPFAAPPVGNLRLRHPEPFQNSWKGVREATVRSPSCPGYGGFDIGLALGEGA